MLAPICLFTYNRIKETKKTVEYLKNNKLANHSIIYFVLWWHNFLQFFWCFWHSNKSVIIIYYSNND